MKLSIIVTVYRSYKELNKYLDRIADLKSNKYEIIFVVNTNNDKSLKKIDEFKQKTKVKVKVIYNSRRLGKSVNIFQAVKLAEGDYIMMHWLTYHYHDNLVLDLLNEAKTKKADIIEFKPWFSTPLRWKAPIRKSFNKTVKIIDKPETFAYTYPLVFNKIFKREIFEKLEIVPTLSYSPDRYSVEFLYKIFLVADTYANCSIHPVKARKYLSGFFNPLRVVKEFEQTINSKFYKDFVQEIQYNKYFSENMIYLTFVKETKNKLLIKKFETKMKKTYDKSDFFTLNKYYLQNNSETTKLREIWKDANPG